jgi:hypothetical protein
VAERGAEMQLDVVAHPRAAGKDQNRKLGEPAPRLPCLERRIDIGRIVCVGMEPDRGRTRPGDVGPETSVGEGGGERRCAARAIPVPDGDPHGPEVAEMRPDEHSRLGPEARRKGREGILQRQVPMQCIAPVGDGFNDARVDRLRLNGRRRHAFSVETPHSFLKSPTRARVHRMQKSAVTRVANPVPNLRAAPLAVPRETKRPGHGSCCQMIACGLRVNGEKFNFR